MLHVAINVYDQGETINVKDISTIKDRVIQHYTETKGKLHSEQNSSQLNIQILKGKGLSGFLDLERN